MNSSKYNNLDNLLDENAAANQFFCSLPEYVREMISDRGDKIHSEIDLRQYADNLLSGDK